MSDTFCVYPYKSLNITPGGGAKLCCVFRDHVSKDGTPMSVYEYSMDEIWNSKDLRDIRHAMNVGEAVPGCEYCYQQERSGVQSLRVSMNGTWQRENQLSDDLYQESVKSLCVEVEAQDCNIADAPAWLELDVGNLCNLKCRMCNGYSSSQIAADPVHSRWAYNGLIAARWQGRGMVIAPQRVLGVASEGIEWPVTENGVKVGWTDGKAGLRFSADGTEVAGISIRLSGNKPADHPLKVSVNSKVIFDGVLPPGPWSSSFDLDHLDGATEFEVRLESPVFQSEVHRRSVGVGIEEIKLLRKPGGKNEINTSRFPGGGLWFQEKEFLLGELLARPEKMTRLRLIGGEPFLIKEVVYMMRHLVDTGAASNITLFSITNCTVANDEFLDLLQKFKHRYLMLSMDGAGTVNEYIRFPSKWDVIDANVDRFKKLESTEIIVNMTVQAYNVLNIVEMLEYCLEKGAGFQYHLMQYPPYLSTAVLPQHIRDLAAERLLAFSKEQEARLSGAFMRADLMGSIPQLAAAIKAQKTPEDDSLLHDFMVFTNDMDSSRGQSFATALPELHELLAAAGIKWTSDKRFAITVGEPAQPEPVPEPVQPELVQSPSVAGAVEEAVLAESVKAPVKERSFWGALLRRREKSANLS